MIEDMGDRELKLSVIVPMYNAEEYLEECLESIEKSIQGLEAEVLLIDDGSEDRTSDIALAFQHEHSRFRYYRKENGGPADAKNYGIGKAKGKYLAFTDSDDLVTESMYHNMVRAAEYHQADLTIVNLVRFNSKRIWGSGLHKRVFNNLKKTVTHIRECDNLIYDTTAANRMIRRDFWEKNGFQYPKGWLFEDMPIALEMHCRANRVAIVHEVGYLWRVRDGESASITQNNSSINNLKHRTAMYDRMFRFVDKEEDGQRLKTLLKEKILSFDFSFYINEMENMTPENKTAYRDLICDFLYRHYDGTELSSLPVITLQKYEYLIAKDYEKLEKTIAYHRKYYSKASIQKADAGYRFVLPEDVFTIPKRLANDDFRWYTPNYYTSDICWNGRELRITGHVYIPRVDIRTPEDLKIQVFLLETVSGRIIELPTDRFQNTQLSGVRGFIYNDSDKTTKEYNYDGTGFIGTLRLDMLPADQNEEYMVFVEYDHVLCQGCLALDEQETWQTEYSDGMELYDDVCRVKITHDAHGAIIINSSVVRQEDRVLLPSESVSHNKFFVDKVNVEGKELCLSLVVPKDCRDAIGKMKLCYKDRLLASHIDIAETTYDGTDKLCFRIDFTSSAILQPLYSGKFFLEIEYDKRGKHTYSYIDSLHKEKGRVTTDSLEVMIFGDHSNRLTLYTRTLWDSESNSGEKRRYLKKEVYPSLRKLPLDSQCVLFEEYDGKIPQHAPARFYEYLTATHPELKCIWALEDDRMPVGGSGRRVRKYSKEYYYYLATAKYLVSNIGFGKGFKKRSSQIEIIMPEPYPLYCSETNAVANYQLSQKNKEIEKRISHCDYLVVAGNYSARLARKWESFRGALIKASVQFSDRTEPVERIKSRLQIPGDKRIVTYAPGYRSEADNRPSLDLLALQTVLGDEYCVITFFDHFDQRIAATESIIDLSNYRRVEDIIAITDVLVTDYSFTMFYAVSVEKPIVVYLGDLASNENSPEHKCFEMERNAPGAIVKTPERLEKAIRIAWDEHVRFTEDTQSFKKNYGAFEGESSFEIVYSKCFIDKNKSKRRNFTTKLQRLWRKVRIHSR